MAPRPPPPPPPQPYQSEMMRMMEAMVHSMQQQNVALVQQNTIALQNLEAARVASENARVVVEHTQRQFMDVMTCNRALIGSSSSSSTVAPTQEWSLESFLHNHPAKFDGKCTPDEADQWLRDMERIYNAKRCPDDNRLAFTEYLLTGEASH